jgi:hypothetical protein
VIRTATAVVWFYAGADRDRRAAHLDDLTPAAALTIMAESLSERGDWACGSLADVNDPDWAQTVMGGLSTPRRTLMAGFPGIHRDGTRASIRRSVVPGIRKLAVGSRPRLAA